MARCELTGKQPEVKNLVSHSNIKTKSVSNPNVQQKRIFSRALNQMVNLKMATSTIRSMEHMGGFDTFLLNQPDSKLSKRALEVKTRILRRLRRKSNQGAKKS
ncbi:MAG: 50S ribosomal protein L28 [Bdellovibrionales bacterium]